MGTLKFARELAQFEEHLDWYEHGGGDGYRGVDSALAASYKVLIERLAELEEHLDAAELGPDAPRIPDIIAEAMAVFREEEASSGKEWQKRRQAAEEEHAEALRRHELAVTVECPYCGAQPGTYCRTAGPSGAGHQKGLHDHKDRYRAATDPEWKQASTSAASGDDPNG